MSAANSMHRAEAAGIPRELGTPEVIRRSRAVELMQSNVPLPVVQKILGHSTPNLAASYVEFSDDEIREVARYFADRENRLKTSARNTFFGKIDKVRRGDVQTMVEMVSLGGVRICSVITNDSHTRLGLKPGTLATAEVKAPWVMLFKGEEEPLCTAENRFCGKVSRDHQGKGDDRNRGAHPGRHRAMLHHHGQRANDRWLLKKTIPCGRPSVLLRWSSIPTEGLCCP